MLAGPVRETGVIAASGGNFGLGVAYAARKLGHPAEIFIPDTTPEVKPNRMREIGATVRIVPCYYAEALEASIVRAEQTGALLLHAYDQPEVVAGDGTIGMEILDQVPEVDTVLVSVGGAGLIGGIAGWFGGDVKVIGVEPEACPSLFDALKAGHPVDVEVGGIAADSLGAARVGENGFASASRYVDRVELVSDDEIREAQRRLWERLRILAEPGAAAAAAAITSGVYRPEPGERVVVLVCGANFDPSTLGPPRTP
jgi:threonine dehydratase